MRQRILMWLSLTVFLFGTLPAAAQMEVADESVTTDKAVQAPPSEEKKPNKRVFGKSDEESFKGKVVIIKVGNDDLVNTHAFKFWRRVIERVNDEGAKAIVFEIDTPGGLAMDTADLIMVQMQKLKVPSYAFINQKALSAGALVAAGTDGIYMHPVSAVGSAALVSGNGMKIEEVMRAKIESAFDAFVRSVAESKGHNPDVLRAMMFRDEKFKFGEVRVKKGKLLTLTATEATQEFEGKPLFAKGIVTSVDELLEKEGLGDLPVIKATPTGMESFAYWVASLSGILILVGIGGAYLEMKTPGFGIGGAISLCAFAVFFFGNYAAGNMAGYGLMLLFILGVVLVVVELFVLPGMLIPGILGGILIMTSLFFAMIDEFAFDDNAVRGWDAAGAWDFVARPALNLGIGLLGSMILLLLMVRFLPDMPIFNKLVMGGEVVSGTSSDNDSETADAIIGMTGVVKSDLRPAGKAEIDGHVIDVTAANGFIDTGKTVRVVSRDGLRIIVEEA